MPTVLLIEENPKLAGMIGKFLQKKGLSSDIASDAVSAVRAFAGGDIALLLVARELQKIDGESLCRRIRESAKGRDVPIIMMSGAVKEPSHIERLKNELRLSGFLTKPFSSDALFALISSSISLRDAGPADAPQPGDRKNIKGDLRQVPFEQVLLYLLTKRGTGVLTLTRGSVERKIFFIDGAAVDVQPSAEEDGFGQYLAAKALASPAELREYEERKKREADDPRDLFVKMGALSPQRLREECENFLRDRLIESFTWKTGSCSFEWLPSFMKSVPAARSLMPSFFFHGFRTHLPPVSISDFLGEKGSLYVDKTVEFYDYQNHFASELAGAGLLELIDGLKTGYQIMDSTDNSDAATVLYTLDYLHLLSYSTAPKSSGVAAPFPVREREAGQQTPEKEKFEDLGGELRELSNELGGLEHLKGSGAAGPEGLTALEEDLKKKWAEVKTKNYYELFGMTQSTFSFDKVKKSYFEYARTYGPEKFFASSGEIMELAEELLSKLSHAYETLTNVVSKENYDELISSQEQVPTKEEDKEFYEKVQFQSGKVLLEQGQCESAEKAFTNCTNIDPNKPEYYAYLALAVYSNAANKGNAAASKRAKDLVNKSLKLGKLSIAYALKGTMLLDEGSFNFAEAEFNKALKLNPNNKTALKKMEFIKAQREGEKKGLFQRIFK